jgi:hypothetical protein
MLELKTESGELRLSGDALERPLCEIPDNIVTAVLESVCPEFPEKAERARVWDAIFDASRMFRRESLTVFICDARTWTAGYSAGRALVTGSQSERRF